MKILDFGCYVLTSCLATAMLAACGGSHLATGAQDTMPLGRKIVTRAAHGASWILPEAKGRNLIYVTSADLVNVYTYSGKLIGSLHIQGATGLCSDLHGNVFVLNGGAILEYAHGGMNPIGTLPQPSGYHPYGCSVDPATGNLAVTDYESISEGPGNVAIYLGAQGTPQLYSDPDISRYVYCAYDPNGNLFVNGMRGDRGNGYLAELPSGGSTLTTISLNQTIKRVSAVQWDGQHIAVGDSYYHVVYQLSITGSQAVVLGTTRFKRWKKGHGIEQFWIENGSILIPYRRHGALRLGFWRYPAGGAPSNSFFLQYLVPNGVTVSVAPHAAPPRPRGRIALAVEA